MALELRNRPAKFTHDDYRSFKFSEPASPLEAVRVRGVGYSFVARKPKEGQRGRLKQVQKRRRRRGK